MHNMLNAVIPAFIAILTKDKDRTVVMATLQALTSILKTLRSVALQENDFVDGIAAVVKSVLLQKVSLSG